MKRVMMCVAVTIVMASATSSHARKVYLNGVDISSLREQRFEDVTVTIDKAGNVRIIGSRYEVREVDPAPKSPSKAVSGDRASFTNPRGGPNPGLTKRYFLVTVPSATYSGSYSFEVKINGVLRRIERAGSRQSIVEISKWLKKGKNEIVVIAERSSAPIGGKPRRTSLVIGPGHEEKSIIKIEKEALRVTADESKTGTIRRTVRLDAR